MPRSEYRKVRYLMKQTHQADLKAYRAGNGFIGRYQQIIRETVIPYQYAVLNDRIEGAEKSHAVQNFINAGAALRGEEPGDGFYGWVFQDSDVAKWLEAVAYSLANHPDSELEATADQVIDYVAAAQDEDGYLNTYFTIKDREKRWQNLMEAHEMYCAGHMMEAACAYYEATGKDKLLKVMEKNAEHIYRLFVTEGHEGYPGHPEIELALMKMYRLTGNMHCLELAKHLVDVRGVDADFYRKEKAKRDWSVWSSNVFEPDYAQNGKPVREQNEATGHSVRAVYLYTGMADLAGETDDPTLLAACDRLWNNITQKRMYLTGGIGSTVHGEAFTVDYDLPNDTAYAETCASIGLVFFASRMLENKVDRRYADVMERAFYNTVLAGMQLDGKRFFYVNPLEVVPGISGVAATQRHDLPQRPGWYSCACCPPNVARMITSLGKYAYGENESTAFCHLFADGEICFDNGLKLSCETEYPYGFDVTWRVLEGTKTLAVRIPGWSKKWEMTVNGSSADCQMKDGYVYLDVTAGDEICLKLDSTPYFVYGSTKVPKLSGKTALCRGPLVYCFEGVDNDGDVLSLAVKDGSLPKALDYNADLLNGTVQVKLDAVRFADDGELYSMAAPKEEACEAIAVPYYTWGNRGKNQMRVWMERK